VIGPELAEREVHGAIETPAGAQCKTARNGRARSVSTIAAAGDAAAGKSLVLFRTNICVATNRTGRKFIAGPGVYDMTRVSAEKLPTVIDCNRCNGKMRVTLIDVKGASTITTYHCYKCNETEVKADLTSSSPQ
jgi:hypothetical protein